MAIKRIVDLNIKKRGLFTAVYGSLNEGEFFVDDDLKKYDLWSALYTYLRSEGYQDILFYDATNNFHSFEQKPLLHFLNVETVPDTATYRAEHIKRPFGNRLRPMQQRSEGAAKTGAVSHNSIQLIANFGRQNNFYRTRVHSFLLDYFTRFLAAGDQQSVIIIKFPDNSPFEHQDQYLTIFRQVLYLYEKDESRYKIIVVYSCDNAHALIEKLNRNNHYLFVDDFFKQLFLTHRSDGHYELKPEHTFQISYPDDDEIRNWINRKRLMQQLDLFGPIGFEKVIGRLLQERKCLKDLEHLDLSAYITNIGTTTAWERLDQLIGLKSFKQKIKDIVADMKYIQAQNAAVAFRPHLCFIGNPGTGKTTAAGIVADIFKEEGILPIGHYVKTKATELMGNHIGDAAELVFEKCEEATGGVLFIDEAYAFIEEGTKAFGDSAVTELITWLEDKDWQRKSIAILAGYQEEIDELFTKSNRGLKSRFNPEHFVYFENYTADELLEIFEWNAMRNKLIVNLDARTVLAKVFAQLLLTNKDSKDWDNARRVENIFQMIFSSLRRRNSHEVTVADIPENLKERVHGNQQNNIRESAAYKELSALIGLEQVKRTIEDLIESIEFEQYQISTGRQAVRKSVSLHLVFSGPPGTGKTTVARLFGDLLHILGVLPSGHMLETQRKDLVGQFIGETAQKTSKIIEKSMGGVLFIDEAYTLSTSMERDYGQEAIDTLLPIMENQRDRFVVIAAGYQEHMDKFLTSNPGLADRFNQTVRFPNYSIKELQEIFAYQCAQSGHEVEPGCWALTENYFETRITRDGDRFSNSRASRKLNEETVKQQQKRLNRLRFKQVLNDVEIKTLTVDDILAATKILLG